jgi:hypothetical protein
MSISTEKTHQPFIPMSGTIAILTVMASAGHVLESEGLY